MKIMHLSHEYYEFDLDSIKAYFKIKIDLTIPFSKRGSVRECRVVSWFGC